MMSNIEKVVSFVWKIACVVFGIPLLLVALDASLRAMESNFSVWRVVRTSWWWGAIVAASSYRIRKRGWKMNSVLSAMNCADLY